MVGEKEELDIHMDFAAAEARTASAVKEEERSLGTVAGAVADCAGLLGSRPRVSSHLIDFAFGLVAPHGHVVVGNHGAVDDQSQPQIRTPNCQALVAGTGLM